VLKSIPNDISVLIKIVFPTKNVTHGALINKSNLGETVIIDGVMGGGTESIKILLDICKVNLHVLFGHCTTKNISNIESLSGCWVNGAGCSLVNGRESGSSGGDQIQQYVYPAMD